MRFRRIVIERGENDKVNVIDNLTGETLATFNYEWRAVKYADELTREYKRNGEPVVIKNIRR